MKGPTLGLSQQVVEAGSSPILETQGRAASSSVNAGTVRYYQTGPGSPSKPGWCTNPETSGRTLSSEEPAPNLVDMGRTAVHVPVVGGVHLHRSRTSLRKVV
jgi:hypothetical protein